MKDIEKICVKKLPTYCKKCGKVIDDETKICTGCGKKYFSFKRLINNKILVNSIIIVILFSSMGYNIYQENVIKGYKNELNKANEKVYLQNQTIDETRADYNEAQNKIADLEDEISYKDTLLELYASTSDELGAYQANFAFYTSDGEKYHKYSCSHIKNRDLYCGLINDLNNRGYKPCKDCYK